MLGASGSFCSFAGEYVSPVCLYWRLPMYTHEMLPFRLIESEISLTSSSLASFRAAVAEGAEGIESGEPPPH